MAWVVIQKITFMIAMMAKMGITVPTLTMMMMMMMMKMKKLPHPETQGHVGHSAKPCDSRVSPHPSNRHKNSQAVNPPQVSISTDFTGASQYTF